MDAFGVRAVHALPPSTCLNLSPMCSSSSRFSSVYCLVRGSLVKYQPPPGRAAVSVSVSVLQPQIGALKRKERHLSLIRIPKCDNPSPHASG